VDAQQGVGAEARVVLDDGVRPDAAAVADDGVGADHAVRPEEHARPDRGRRVDDGRRVTLAPLSEALPLAVEVLEQYRHSHRHVLDRKAAAERGFRCGEPVGDVALRDEDGGATFAGGCELRLVTDEDEAAGTRIARHVAVGGCCFRIALQVREDVAMPALDRVCNEHGDPFW
jgi:hypothetical protein